MKELAIISFALICILALVWFFSASPGSQGPMACTAEAMLCPDGSAVGRTGPNCEFAPCPECTCPGGYRQDGGTCTPECHYSNPPCPEPTIKCS